MMHVLGIASPYCNFSLMAFSVLQMQNKMQNRIQRDILLAPKHRTGMLISGMCNCTGRMALDLLQRNLLLETRDPTYVRLGESRMAGILR